MVEKKTAIGISCLGLGIVIGIGLASFFGVLTLPSEGVGENQITFPEGGGMFPEWGENRERENIAPYENAILALSENLKPGVVSLMAVVSGMEGAPGGTGFVVHSEGYILTNAHVAEGYSEFTVDTMGDENYTAEVLAVGDPDNVDVAVLKVDVQMPNVRVLEFGDSEKLEDNDILFGIGHPGCFGSWVITAGEFIAPEYFPEYFYPAPHLIYVDKPGGVERAGAHCLIWMGKSLGSFIQEAR